MNLGEKMYAKIYKEVFIKNYALKKKLRDNIWVVKLDNQNYYLFVYEDTEEVTDFKNYNEAELLSSKFSDDTFSRIKANRIFLEKIKTFRKSNSYLFRSKSDNQGCLFCYDNYVV